MLRVGPREGVGGAAASAALSALPLQRLTAKQTPEAVFTLPFVHKRENLLRISFINKTRY